MRAQRLLVVTALFVAESAYASCSHLIPSGGKLARQQVSTAYTALIQCDRETAEKNFKPFLVASGDVDTVATLARTAIDNEVYYPVWSMLDDVPDYGARDDIAKSLGETCAEHPNMVSFFQGAYFGLGDRQFGQWREALKHCELPSVITWLEGTIAAPPKQTYDKKYNTVMEAYIEHKQADALPVLQGAATTVAAAEGPLQQILDQMTRAMRPSGFGATLSDEALNTLADALGAVGEASTPSAAKQVAETLYQLGREGQAASLLPIIYADRLQQDQTLLYGAAAIETCGKDHVVHWHTVTEPGTLWSIQAAVEETARASKARLKCTSDEPWTVLVTTEPYASRADVASWAETLAAPYEANGGTVKLKEEKTLRLK